MFSRNKRQQKTAPQKPPVKPMPKEPVLATSPLVSDDEPTLGSKKTVAAEVPAAAPVSPAVPKPGAVDKVAQPAMPVPVARGQADSTLSNMMVVKGNLVTSGALSVNGHIIGDVEADEFELGLEGIVEGSISANRVSISGTVNGAIYATDVSLTQSARVNGDIEHQALSIESGAELNGAVRRRDNANEETAQSEAPAIELSNDSVVSETKPEAEAKVEEAEVVEEGSAEELRAESTLPTGKK